MREGMEPRHYFPLGKAYGEAFCNREEETQVLEGNLQSGKHTFIAAPRRYGKSSLCHNAVKKTGLPVVEIDLHIATQAKEVSRQIINGIVKLIGQSIGNLEKSIQLIKNLFRSLTPRLSMEKSGFKLDFEIASNATPAEIIQESILVLESLLRQKQQKAILVVDEFQRVMEIAPDAGLEGGIRSAAQQTQWLAIIFSGSSRHMIESIFQDEGRPLYKLCRKIRLERISTDHYRQHLNKAAQAMWSQNLAQEPFDMIMHYTQRHPYYVNYLCDLVWSQNIKAQPTKQAISEAWEQLIEEERSDLLGEFYSLTETQKRVLIYLAHYPGNNLYTGGAAQKMDVKPTSIPKALKSLQRKDLVEKDKQGSYCVINPAYSGVL